MLRIARDEYLRLKLRYKAPIIGAFLAGYTSAAVLSYVFAAWLARVLDVSLRDPVRDQPHGWLWAVLFCGFFLLAMVIVATGMLALLTGLWAMCYGWSFQRAKNVFVNSELPQDWFRPAGARRSPHSGSLP